MAKLKKLLVDVNNKKGITIIISMLFVLNVASPVFSYNYSNNATSAEQNSQLAPESNHKSVKDSVDLSNYKYSNSVTAKISNLREDDLEKLANHLTNKLGILIDKDSLKKTLSHFSDDFLSIEDSQLKIYNAYGEKANIDFSSDGKSYISKIELSAIDFQKTDGNLKNYLTNELGIQDSYLKDVAWFQDASNHLSKGINYSISINLEGSDPQVTLSQNGKAVSVLGSLNEKNTSNEFKTGSIQTDKDNSYYVNPSDTQYISRKSNSNLKSLYVEVEVNINTDSGETKTVTALAGPADAKILIGGGPYCYKVEFNNPTDVRLEKRGDDWVINEEDCKVSVVYEKTVPKNNNKIAVPEELTQFISDLTGDSWFDSREIRNDRLEKLVEKIEKDPATYINSYGKKTIEKFNDFTKKVLDGNNNINIPENNKTVESEKQKTEISTKVSTDKKGNKIFYANGKKVGTITAAELNGLSKKQIKEIVNSKSFEDAKALAKKYRLNIVSKNIAASKNVQVKNNNIVSYNNKGKATAIVKTKGMSKKKKETLANALKKAKNATEVKKILSSKTYKKYITDFLLP